MDRINEDENRNFQYDKERGERHPVRARIESAVERRRHDWEMEIWRTARKGSYWIEGCCTCWAHAWQIGRPGATDLAEQNQANSRIEKWIDSGTCGRSWRKRP